MIQFLKSKVIKIRRRGSVLVYGIMVFAMLILIALAVASATLMDKGLSLATPSSNKSFQVADSGVEIFQNEIKDVQALATGETIVENLYKNTNNTLNSDTIFVCDSNGKLTDSTAAPTFSVSMYKKSDGTPLKCGVDDTTLVEDVGSIKSQGVSGDTTRAVNVKVCPGIKSCQDLAKIDDGGVNTLGKNYFLCNDIDCAGIGFTPIRFNSVFFYGTFDGKGYAIKNLTINNSDVNGTGLFAQIGYAGPYAGTVKNLVLDNLDITGSSANVGAVAGILKLGSSIDNVIVRNSVIKGNTAGGLVGSCSNSATYPGPISNSSVENTVRIGDGGNYYTLGGLVGSTMSGEGCTIRNSRSEAQIDSTYGDNNKGFGGLVGENAGIIEKSFAGGNVVASLITANTWAGGLVGYVTATSSISDSYATGHAKAYNAGGFEGLGTATSVALKNSYSIGLVTGSASGRQGGFNAMVPDSNTTASFWNTGTSGQANCSGGTPLPAVCGNGIKGKTTTEMKTAGTYDASWNTSVWKIQDGSYPCLIGVTPGC